MQIVDFAILPPGACFLTGTSQGQMIDTMLDVDDLPTNGRLYISVAAAYDLGVLVGCTPPNAARKAQERITELERAVTEQAEVIAGLMHANEALLHAGPLPAINDAVPIGSADDILAWVRSDPEQAVDRASRASLAELEELSPRIDLLDQLSAVMEEVS